LSPARRRALSRQVRDAFPPMGVYAVRHRATGAVLLVAASRNVPGTLNRIRFELQRQGCRQPLLQQAWDREGPQALAFEPLEFVRQRLDPGFDHDAELRTLLQLWTEELRPTLGTGAPR
jgi:hypothetical protein